MAWFNVIQSLPGVRAFVFHLAVGVFDLYAATTCLRCQGTRNKTTFGILGALLMLLAGSGLIRGVTLLVDTPDPSGTAAPLLGWDVQYGVISLAIFLIVTVQLAIITVNRLSREVERQAWHDPLTDALNRRGFSELANRELARAARGKSYVSLISLDIDHFKKFNDLYGHQVGDLMLKAVSQCARGVLRPGDLWARFGGEEFIAMLVDTKPEAARLIAERLRSTIAELPLRARDGSVLKITVSIGVASLAPGSNDWSSALHNADKLLYAAKSAGRNLVFAEESILQEATFGRT